MNNSGIFGLSSNSSVTINGKTYVGRNITINGNKVRVDGNVVEEAVNIHIDVIGNVEKINTTGDIKVHGNVGSAETGAGDIVIEGNVAGDVETGAGSIRHGVIVEFPCSVFTCDPRFNEIEHQIDDMRVGDLNSHALIDVWYDGPDDFVYWIKEDMYDGKYDCITTILSVIRQYLDSRSSDDYEFEQADIDKLFEYAENTQIKAIFLES